MKVYEFCGDSFNYNKINFAKFFKKFYIIFLVFGLGVSYLTVQTFKTFFLPKAIEKETVIIKDDFEKILIANTENEFSKEKFTAKLKSLNLKYPHIAYAQAMLESGNFTSKIFRENNNMFGMKQARVRINLAKSTQYGHAYFDTWEDCLLDFAFHRATYLSKLRTEDDYYAYLGRNYAEDNGYVVKLKKMVKKYNLKDKFK